MSDELIPTVASISAEVTGLGYRSPGSSDEVRRRDGVARVLVLLDFFVPGHRAGGPIREDVARIVESEARAHEVSVVTRDHDLGDPKRFEVATDGWVSTLGARVHYADFRSWAGRRRALSHVRQVKPDLVYLNSLWAPTFTLVPLAWLRVMRRRSVVLLAPRGACGPEALALKSRKKSVVRAVSRRWLRWDQLVWHSTSDQETADIEASMGELPPRVVTRSSSGPTPSAEPSVTQDPDPGASRRFVTNLPCQGRRTLPPDSQPPRNRG